MRNLIFAGILIALLVRCHGFPFKTTCGVSKAVWTLRASFQCGVGGIYKRARPFSNAPSYLRCGLSSEVEQFG